MTSAIASPVSLALLATLTFGRFAVANFDINSANVLRKIHGINQTEMRVGQLAQEKGVSQRVKDYGSQLVKDHADAEQKVVALAKKENIDLSDESSPAIKENRARDVLLVRDLTTAQGMDFDRLFVRKMDLAHQEAIDTLKASEKALKGTPTAYLIGQLLPNLQKHELMAEHIESAE